MEREEIKYHLKRIVGNIASIRSLTAPINYLDFRQNDQVREKIYAYLQEIGQAAHELHAADKRMVPDISADTLASFRNARYNQEPEIHHQNVWNLVELDLPVIGDEIQQSTLYNGRVDSEKVG